MSEFSVRGRDRIILQAYSAETLMENSREAQQLGCADIIKQNAPHCSIPALNI